MMHEGPTQVFSRSDLQLSIAAFTYPYLDQIRVHVAQPMAFRTYHLNGFLLTGLFLLAVSPVSAIDLAQHPGKAIYEKQCLDCHGAQGEGSDKKETDPLIGDRTLESLTGRIERTMPEDNPDDCVGPDARAVAEYVYHAFYSEEAQARLRPVTRDLSHLTGPQMQNSLADVFALVRDTHFSPTLEKSGLKGEYFASGEFKTDKEKMARIDLSRSTAASLLTSEPIIRKCRKGKPG